MPIVQLASFAFVLSCGISAPETKLDRFGRPINAESRLNAPASGQSFRSADLEGTGAAPAWRLLPFERRSAGADPRAIALGNISGQNRPDVVIATSFYFDPTTDYHLLLFRPDGANGFLPPLLYPYGQTADFPSVAVVELDGNHGADVVVGGGVGITRFLSTAAGTLFGSAPDLSTRSMALAVVDLDRDGWKDIASINWTWDGTIHRNLGNGLLQSIPWSTPLEGNNKIGQGDIDGDGLIDVVVGSGLGMTPNIHLYRNTGTGSLEILQSLHGVCPAAFNGYVGGIGIGDVNGDGHADIVASGGGNSPSSCIMIFLSNSEGRFREPIYLKSYDIPQTLRVADIDGDQRADVIVAHGGWEALGVYLQDESGSLTQERLFPIPYASHYYAHSFEVVDLDRDGCVDVALVDYSSGLVTLRGKDCGIVFISGFD